MEDGAVRIGLGYVREVREEAAERLVAERDGRRALPRHRRPGGARRPAPRAARPARAGGRAATTWTRPRRAMLWELGVLARPRAAAPPGRSSPCRSPPRPAPPLPELGRFERTVADYETTGLSTGWHLVTLVRPGLPPGVLTAAELRETPARHATSCVAGLVVARQRPATAGGIVFLLLEDETGMINAIVRPEVYERHRAVVRAEPAGGGLGAARAARAQPSTCWSTAWSGSSRRATPAEREQAAPLARVRAAAPAGQQFGRGRR